MKLVLVFLLAAIPVCCCVNGSSGCKAMDDVEDKTMSSSISVSEYLQVIDKYTFFPYNKDVISRFKQCFLDQSEETLDNMKVMMEAIYNSEDCQ